MNVARPSLLAWITLALAVAASVVLSPLLVPVILAAWTATIARPLLERVEKALRGRNRAAAVLTLVLVIVLLVPVAIFTTAVITGSREVFAQVTTSEGAPSALQALVSSGAAEPSFTLPRSPEQVVETVQRYGGRAYQLLSGIAGAAIRVAVGVLVYVAGAYALLIDGPAAFAWAERHVPLAPGQLRRLAAAFTETGRGLLLGVGLTSLLQALVATIVYAALGIPRALVLGLVTGVAAFVPIAGAAIVWVPVAAGLWLAGSPVKAAIMVALGVLIISSMDNVLRPVLYRFGRMDLSIFMLFLSVFGGLATLGPFGALLGPLVVRLAKEALVLAREERDASRAEP